MRRSLSWRFPVVTLALGLLAAPVMAREVSPQELLDAHNRYRAEVGVAPLVWSEEIAASAQAWADTLAASGRFEHSRDRSYGENLWMGTAGAFSQTHMVDSWGEEKQHFVYGIMPNVTTGGVVGHYTQMVWRNSTQVGCGLAGNADAEYLVCQYDPRGNYRGEKPY